MPDSRTPLEPPSPPQWQNDLNPEYGAGQNRGLYGPTPVEDGLVATAYDIKDLNREMWRFTDDELKQIPVLPTGTALQQGAVYIDLRADQPQEFRAMGNESAGPENWYVPKKEMDYVLWNRLIGVTNPARLDQADDA